MMFLDTEFNRSSTGLQLISIGFAGANREFYAEFSKNIVLARRGVTRNKFLNEHVLPQLGLLNDPHTSPEALANKVIGWLNDLHEAEIQIAYDFHGDYSLLEQLMELATVSLHARLEPTHVGYLLEEPCGISAANTSWEMTSTSRGLSKHHALADALALQARFQAVHGDGA